MFGPTSLLHSRNTIEYDQCIHYVAHIEELEEAIQSLTNGEDYEFSFDLTEYDKHYIANRLKEILGEDFLLDFH